MVKRIKNSNNANLNIKDPQLLRIGSKQLGDFYFYAII